MAEMAATGLLCILPAVLSCYQAASCISTLFLPDSRTLLYTYTAVCGYVPLFPCNVFVALSTEKAKPSSHAAGTSVRVTGRAFE